MIVTRHHDICVAHRLYGYPGKCGRIHGHNYRIHFSVTGKINPQTGMVIDFAIIRATLCEWLDIQWDHRLLLWETDPLTEIDELKGDLVVVPFNPTAENMAQYLLDVAGPMVMPEGVVLETVKIEETRKCSVSTSLVPNHE